MNAVAAAGLERARMREALAAALIKDEADREIFDRLFARFFGGGRERGDDDGRRKRGTESSAAPGARERESESVRPSRGDKRQPSPSKAAARTKPEEKSKQSEAEESKKRADSESEARGAHEEERAPRHAHPDAYEAAAQASAAARETRARRVERTPFERYSELEYEQARDALAPLARRFRVRIGRRLRAARAGRIDFRRTIRASIQRGGALADLRFRARRPRHIDLVILADISGSVRYSSTLMLELIAGARGFFRRVRSFVYIDRLAEADFEDGHLVMTPALDLYARSDFGRVLGELWERRGEILNRATVMVIMGDGRNNRRPARADLLREMARLCRAVIWLIPEERERWGSGDSAIFQYAREVSALIPSRNLRELEEGLSRVA
ncbi:MAG TPA: VWA domain-containing protein, partial [Candidatus Binataceae bacterium]|nr:VWA domain-containing protein [Candidatus Binataceae bacterium]